MLPPLVSILCEEQEIIKMFKLLKNIYPSTLRVYTYCVTGSNSVYTITFYQVHFCDKNRNYDLKMAVRELHAKIVVDITTLLTLQYGSCS